MHDAYARTLGISVAQLLGGRLAQNSASLCQRGPFMRPGADPYARFARRSTACSNAISAPLKPRAGHNPRADALMAKAFRKQIGDDCDLMVDFNQGYTVGAAIDSARAMYDAGARLLWIESRSIQRTCRATNWFSARSPISIVGEDR